MIEAQRANVQQEKDAKIAKKKEKDKDHRREKRHQDSNERKRKLNTVEHGDGATPPPVFKKPFLAAKNSNIPSKSEAAPRAPPPTTSSDTPMAPPPGKYRWHFSRKLISREKREICSDFSQETRKKPEENITSKLHFP